MALSCKKFEEFYSYGSHKALASGHFVLNSGDHSAHYLNKDGLYVRYETISDIGYRIAERFIGMEIDTVIGPAVGGAILSSRVAECFSEFEFRGVDAIYADKDDANKGEFIIKRGYDAYIPGKNILVVEDVLTTGKSIAAVIKEVVRLGGNIVGLGVICNRGGVTLADVGLPDPTILFSLIEEKIETYSADVCPLCAANVPVNTDLGKGAAFLAAQQELL